MYLSIIILPLLGSITSGLLGRKVGITGAQLITCTCLILSSILMTIAFYDIGICASPISINLGHWIQSELLSISWEFYYDSLTISLGLAVLYCSALIHIYSISYMSGDPHPQRFMSYLSLFTFFMLLLISAGNYFTLFVGWEGIGIVSYLLINYYFTRIQSNKSAILALTMNRVGDFGLSIGFFAIVALFGSLNYATIFSIVPYMNETAITIISLLIFIGAMAKSAQLGLHSWLPGSMEAPTPVSALLHAATLVTAGIYLLLRSSPILEYSSTALLIITLIGATTAFIAATSGLVLNDLKRIIAFSTISQLGYYSILIITIFFILSVTNIIDDFYSYNNVIYINYDISIIAFGPFFITTILHIPNKIYNYKKADLILIEEVKDNLSSILSNFDKYNDFSYNERSIIKQKYIKIPGIYLWVNNMNKKCYVGKSINLYLRFSKYLSPSYINSNKNKMGICGAIFKYDINNFTFYILETFDKNKVSQKFLSEKENFWYQIIKPSYNIQSILQPFSGTNHYRFGTKLSESIKSKISNTLKGRFVSETKKINHILGAHKKCVFCYDWETEEFLMEFKGLRIMMRALNLKYLDAIRNKIDKNKPLQVTINGVNKKLLVLSSKKL